LSRGSGTTARCLDHQFRLASSWTVDGEQGVEIVGDLDPTTDLILA
jgi:hypothetical protein